MSNHHELRSLSCRHRSHQTLLSCRRLWSSTSGVAISAHAQTDPSALVHRSSIEKKQMLSVKMFKCKFHSIRIKKEKEIKEKKNTFVLGRQLLNFFFYKYKTLYAFLNIQIHKKTIQRAASGFKVISWHSNRTSGVVLKNS